MPDGLTDFNFTMTKKQLVLGLIWIPVHFFVLPVLLALLILFYPVDFDEVTFNITLQALSFVYLMLVMHQYMKREFYTLAERKLRSLFTLAGGWMLNLMLTSLVGWLIAFLAPGMLEQNPNQETLQGLGEISSGALFALSVCLAPVVEEILFRGCLFGAIRRKHRVLAYIVSALAFSFIHVGQYALIGQDLSLFLYMVEYVPISIALAWCYERSGSLWTSIFLHMAINAVAVPMM